MRTLLINSLLIVGAYFFPTSAIASNNPTEGFSEEPALSMELSSTYEDSNADGEYSDGDFIYYSFTLSNTGSADLRDFTLSSSLGQTSGNLSSLAAGDTDSESFSAKYQLSQEDIDGGGIALTFTMKASTATAEAVEVSVESVMDIYVQGAIKLTKTGTYYDADQNGILNHGDEIHYSFVVKNSCHISLAEVMIEDEKVEVLGGPISLAPGQKDKTSFTAIYTISQEDILAGKVVNKATAIGVNPHGELIKNSDTHTLILEVDKDLLCIEKTSDTRNTVVGAQFNYTISITNHAKFAFENLSIKDEMPEILLLVSSSHSFVEENHWKIDRIEAGETVEIELTVMAMMEGEAVNKAHLTVGEYCLVAKAKKVCICGGEMDLAITKTSNGTKIFQGDTFEYSIHVTNQGKTAASEVVITDFLPSNLDYISSSYVLDGKVQELTEEYTGMTVIWSLPELAAGESLDITLVVVANKTGKILNKVMVEALQEDADTKNNEDTDLNEVLELFIPNVFTPGRKDGINDTFVVRGVNQFPTSELTVMSRWGDHVFEKENYQNDWTAEGLASGAYYYVLKATDSEGRNHIFKGWVQVIKSQASISEQ
ncbi:DUF7507 domain-containing protein [Echinicola pacifica]|nr:gliding motility-associated C-terminal domain-containing protein [Echinicola pacifica]